MRSRAGRLTISILVFLAAGSTGLRGAPEAPLDWRDAAEWKGRHYRVRSCTSKEHAEQVGTLLEGFYGAFFRFAKGTPLRLHEVRNLPVTVFGDREGYRKAMQQIDPKRVNSFGFYAKSGDVYCYRRMEGSVEATSETLLHEATHQLADQAANACKVSNKPGYWVVEGLADYFGGGRVEEGKFVVGIRGVRLYRAMLMLKSGQIEPLEKFVVRTVDGYESPQYGQGCLLTHFFMDGNDARYRKDLLSYVKLVFQSRGSRDAFVKAFRQEPGAFDEAFLDYLKKVREEHGEGTRSDGAESD